MHSPSDSGNKEQNFGGMVQSRNQSWGCFLLKEEWRMVERWPLDREKFSLLKQRSLMLVTVLFLCELERASSISGDKGGLVFAGFGGAYLS